jgi:L-serine dehydratase
MKLSRDAMRKGLVTTDLVGFLCKDNASVAGAEVGCQGEIGVAAAMAATMITYATGASLEATEIVATIAVEHRLGMPCDPVGGFCSDSLHRENRFRKLRCYNNIFIIAKFQAEIINASNPDSALLSRCIIYFFYILTTIIFILTSCSS